MSKMFAIFLMYDGSIEELQAGRMGEALRLRWRPLIACSANSSRIVTGSVSSRAQQPPKGVCAYKSESKSG
jgi:hypothetical protein